MSEELSDPAAEALARVYAELLARAPENKMEARMAPMWRAMEVLGDPQKAYPVVHLTGTNGKTSTARMIESGLRSYGLRTGRYTSPHLSSVTERVSIDGEPVSAETFVRIWDEISPHLALVDAELEAAGEPRLTYFEALTVLGFAIFADEPVDVAVIEVGLGGITDATNVADGLVSVVTPISLDHTELLGDTPGEIAVEKSGIIKPGGFLVSATQPADAADVLLNKAREVGAQFRFEGVEFDVEERKLAVGGQLLTISGLAGRYPEIFVPLHGDHQAQNAAVAVAALEAFFSEGSKELQLDLLQEAFANVTSPGRLETLRGAPAVVVDAAHNPAGVRVTAEALKEALEFSKLSLVLGVLAEKDALGILNELHEAFIDVPVEIAVTQSNSPRAIPAAELGEIALDAGFAEDDIHVTEKLDEAIEWAVERAESNEDLAGMVLITGSITLVADARILLGRG